MERVLQIPERLPEDALEWSDVELGSSMLLFYAAELARVRGLPEIGPEFLAAAIDRLQNIDGDYQHPDSVKAEKILQLAARGAFERAGRLARASITAARLQESLENYAREAYKASSERRSSGGSATAAQRKEEAEKRYEPIRGMATRLLAQGREPQNIVALIKERVQYSKPTIRKALETHPSGNWSAHSKKKERALKRP